MAHTIKASCRIDADQKAVFDVIGDCRNFAKAVPHIEQVTILSEIQHGVGLKFRETRIMKGRSAAADLEVTEFDPPERIRIVSDVHGTVWDSVFLVRSDGNATTVTLTMEATPRTLMAKIMTPLAMKMMRPALEGDLKAVKAYCESASA
ncbi:MAG: hypothetical protein ACI9W4_000280 [Rhodothermales bacterium]|jgi:carbon monoxide dehydrogenase subunit G